ncbi:MAG: hypothetical protein WBH00_11570 [Xanthobacteraceae bacterium]
MPKATKTNITNPPAAANPYESLMNHLDGEISILTHLSRFLSNDLEFGLNRKRGRLDQYGGIDLTFQLDSIDATTWLAGEIWERLARLDKRLVDFHNANDEKAEVVA